MIKWSQQSLGQRSNSLIQTQAAGEFLGFSAPSFLNYVYSPSPPVMIRILNRFAGDTGSNDDILPATVFDFTMCLFYVSGAILTAIVALPFILVVMPPLIWYFVRVRKIFVITSRELKRFEGLARSPIFAMLSESINGISTIRPNGVETYISKKFEDYHDTHSRAFWSFLASSRWLGFRMDFLMYVNCSVSCFLAVLFSVEGEKRIIEV